MNVAVNLGLGDVDLLCRALTRYARDCDEDVTHVSALHRLLADHRARMRQQAQWEVS